MVSIGKAEYGRSQPMLSVIAPANFEKLERYKENSYIMFNRSPVFKLAPSAGNQGVNPIAWFGEEEPFRSG